MRRITDESSDGDISLGFCYSVDLDGVDPFFFAKMNCVVFSIIFPSKYFDEGLNQIMG